MSGPLRGTPPEALDEAVTYRLAYGIAADLAAEHRFEEAKGYVADDQVDDVLVAELVEAVSKQLGIDPEGGKAATIREKRR